MLFCRFLLFVVCVANCKEFPNQLAADSYPCDKLIVVGYDNSLSLEAFKYERQIDFMVDLMFDKWNNYFYRLSMLSYGSLIYKNTGKFKTKTDIVSFLRNDEQIESDTNLCDICTALNGRVTSGTNIILFLREFNRNEVDADCRDYIQSVSQSRMTFVQLSDDLNVNDLTDFFPDATVVSWAIGINEAPDDWERQIYKGYGCGELQPKTRNPEIPTTTSPSKLYPCNNQVAIIFDCSNNLDDTAYDREKSFLIKHVFKDWTNFNGLMLWAYATDVQKNKTGNLQNIQDVDDFIQYKIHLAQPPKLCSIFVNLATSTFPVDYQSLVIFLSDFTPENGYYLCKNEADIAQNTADFLTFVLLNDGIHVEDVRYVFPQAQFIRWDIANEEIPQNWEPQFMLSYGCTTSDDVPVYPCNNKVIVGYDESSEINTEIFETQKQFLFNNMFTDNWNLFKNLALIAYSKDIRVNDFGSMHNLSDVREFIDIERSNSSFASVCRVFERLSTMYTQEVNIILFVTKFYDPIIGDSYCLDWIQQIQPTINSITFINLTKQFTHEHLLSLIPQANFMSWEILTNNAPDNWNENSDIVYGCNGDFTVKTSTYPCNSAISINYDVSRYLSRRAYQKLVSFFQKNVFIQQWTYFSYLYVVSYANDINFIQPITLAHAKFFVRQNLKTIEEPDVCDMLTRVVSFSHLDIMNYVFFVSKFDSEVVRLDETCTESINTLNKSGNKKTFIKLGNLVNETFLKKQFRNITIVPWNVEEEDEFPQWNQILWDAFGCTGFSPIVLVTTPAPSTMKQTTPLKTTTDFGFQSTRSISVKTNPATTILPISSTAVPVISSSSKLSDSGGNSNERAILLGVFIPLFIIFLISIVIIVWWCRRKNRQNLVDVLAAKEMKLGKNRYGRELDDPWTISPDFLQINYIDKLGSGAFGDVYLGKLIDDAPVKKIYSDSPHCQRFNNCDVAVKTLPFQSDEWARGEFQKEIEFMKDLKIHVNLVCFLGYVSDPTNPLMLLEYCSNGDLLHFIKSNKQKFIESIESQEENTDSRTLTSFAWQISSGLEYLGSLGLIHRDIAARNVLLDKNNVCKISDFGLCRNSANQFYLSSGGRLPIKWMAPESLKDNMFSTMTDVWSYGVLLWELFTLGQIPYPHVENVLAFIESGKRLEKPKYCSEDMYELMLDSWQVDPNDRPTFTIICQLLTKKMETATLHYNYVDTLALIEESNNIGQTGAEYAEISDLFEFDSESVNV